ncbi:transketolase [Patescibacteria group bacterium]|nr:transketolase [Patescibacteria group bacterium]
MKKNNHLEQKTRWVREEVLRMAYEVGGCHLAGPLSATDLLVVLYFSGLLNYRADQPKWTGRDRLILSCGHYAPAWYAVLARAGYFPSSELKNLRQFGSRLQGHPSRRHANFVEASSGLLGQGLSVGVGMGLGLRLAKKTNQVWVLCSDAEPQEGQFWEAVQAASKFRLGNLQLIIDQNNIQIDGQVEEVMPQRNLAAKLKEFGWLVIELDGHDLVQLKEGYQTALEVKDKPVAIVAKTTAGKGVSFMENDWRWHDGRLSKAQLALAVGEVQDG